jgi:hypothetical protein
MSADYTKSVFKHILAWLKDNNKPTSKISMQKILFYLQEKGIPLRLDFEPYSYGPFSRQIMETASELHKAGVISVGRTDYTLGQDFSDALPDEDRRVMDSHLERFSNLLGHDFSFGTLELYGTVLYCIQALKEIGREADSDSVIQEVKAWKGSKFPEDAICKAYEALSADFIS